MIKLYDGRCSAWQWDYDLFAIVPGAEQGDTIQFSNDGQTAAVVKAVAMGASVVAPVPNDLLQMAAPISVYRFIDTAEGGRTVFVDILAVSPKAKPDDYVYTPTEVLTWEQLDARVTALEQGGHGTKDHNALDNRDLNDQHPMSAISGLIAALGAKQPAGNYLTTADGEAIQAALDGKQPKGNYQPAGDYLTAEDGEAIQQALDGKQPKGNYQPAGDYLTPTDKAALEAAIAAKQNALVSGENIKNVNGKPIMGAGNLEIAEANQETVYGFIQQYFSGISGAYQLLNSVISSGHSWIDTGVTLDGSLALEMTLSVPASKISAALVAHNSSTVGDGRMGFMAFNTQSHKIAYFWPGVAYTELTLDSNINMAEPFTVRQDKNGISVTQGDYTSTAAYNGTEATNTATLQILHSENPNHAEYQSGTVYSAKISKGGAAVRDYAPVLRNADNVAGLLDVVNMVFTASQGTEPFTAGTPIPAVNNGDTGVF